MAVTTINTESNDVLITETTGFELITERFAGGGGKGGPVSARQRGGAVGVEELHTGTVSPR